MSQSNGLYSVILSEAEGISRSSDLGTGYWLPSYFAATSE
jgi:hypothetical protein